MRQTQVTLVDDLDGGRADETVSFRVDGKAYEIDLSTANVIRLRDTLAPYIAVARRASSNRRQAARSNGTQTDRARNQAIREWARGQGLKIADRGRIPDEIQVRYDNLS
jgi:hypothetical protein